MNIALMTSIVIEQASRSALRDLQGEWDSKICPVCRAAKWAFYPFCRACSIKAQCAHLMLPFVYLRGRSSAEIEQRIGNAPPHWLGHYDRARDFLFAVHAGRTNVRRVKRHTEEEC